MNRLLKIGFQCVGRWKMVDGNLEFELTSHAYSENVLYAFVSNGNIKYIGKTTQKLKNRMQGYKRPGPTQSTNIKNKANIEKLLKRGEVVDIFVLPDSGLMHYGDFHLNLAAGLEDSLISVISPPWNGSKKNKKDKNETKKINVKTRKTDHLAFDLNATISFDLTLEKTYYKSGFFNVKKEFSEFFGKDKDEIEIYISKDNEPLRGYINRSATSNNSPRIMGGKELKDWFQKNFDVMDKIKVDVLSPVSIFIHKKV
jgi:hypothetical protein